ncbi:MAG TPA: MarR family transcriptional regulator [Galbitalea sp.]|jgi:DNA-binding MarR family transcriptional regulator|nr:MarR family transcriptional regulator [Galbitalea sp.]
MSRSRVEKVLLDSVVPDSVPARLSLVTGRLNRRLAAADGGLSHGLLTALATAAKHGPLRLAELARLNQVSAPSMTRTVSELENRGLVVRGVDPRDGRAIQVAATPAGLAAILRARAARAEVVAELLHGLDASEIRAIEAALPALERALDLP